MPAHRISPLAFCKVCDAGEVAICGQHVVHGEDRDIEKEWDRIFESSVRSWNESRALDRRWSPARVGHFNVRVFPERYWTKLDRH